MNMRGTLLTGSRKNGGNPGYLELVPWVNAEADAAHGAGVSSEPPGTRRVKA
jgi:hypothetical protein